MTAPCYGKSALFDSPSPIAHVQAAAICATCPMLAACTRLRDDVLSDNALRSEAEGTWAGKLLDPYGAKRKRDRARYERKRGAA